MVDDGERIRVWNAPLYLSPFLSPLSLSAPLRVSNAHECRVRLCVVCRSDADVVYWHTAVYRAEIDMSGCQLEERMARQCFERQCSKRQCFKPMPQPHVWRRHRALAPTRVVARFSPRTRSKRVQNGPTRAPVQLKKFIVRYHPWPGRNNSRQVVNLVPTAARDRIVIESLVARQ